MVTIDESNYPIVSIKFEGVTTLEETQMYLDRFSDWLSRENPFGLIVDRASL